LEVWEWGKSKGSYSADTTWQTPRENRNQLLPLVLRRGKRRLLIDETTRFEDGDMVEWLVLAEAMEAAHERLGEQGWSSVGVVEE
jgi:hypothetical protein